MPTTNMMAHMLVRLSILVAVAAASPAMAKQILPRDECLDIDGYFDFRQKIEDIIRRRDAPALATIVDNNIEWSYGGESGKQDFLKAWEFSKGSAAKIWPELDKMVRLGCGKSNGGIAFPYLFTVDVGSDGAGAGYGTITGNGVNLRSAPSPQASVTAKLSWDVIEFIGQADGGWEKIKTSDGRTGFVKTEFTRGMLDYRAGFSRKDGKWAMTYFIAGD